ncbi:NlpC/P60 family protein [Scopulibacillus cellulosilyticus]|uniref:NlpC/P60 family protein n=1 Tax=Scopulibacillus cellulosilyticus TaxID=2665665 RepID=A0ABW2PWC4_9BACL
MLKPKGIVRKLVTTTTVAGVMAIAPLALHPGSASAHSPSIGLKNQSTNYSSQSTVVHKSVPVSKQNTQSSGLLQSGDRGQAVSNLQSKLNSKGYLKGGVDGIYGPNTANAVRQFQSANGLSVDGIAGPDTLSKLNGNSVANNNNGSNSSNSNNNSQSNNTTVNNDNSKSNNDNVYHPMSAPANNNQSSNVSDMAYHPNNSANNQDTQKQVSGSEIASIAKQYNGAPYADGGMSPSGFDCSGFIKYVFQQAGIDLAGRSAADLYNDGTPVSSPSVGDVVFFSNTYKPGISHAGIYLGNGQMISAENSNTGVKITDLSISYWQNHLAGYRSYN